MQQQEAIDSSAYKILNSMIQDKVDEMKSLLKVLNFRFQQAKKPTYYDYSKKEHIVYKPTLRVGVSFDKKEEINIPFDIRSLESVQSLIEDIIKLQKEIDDLNREKLYLVQADGDWQDGGRRSKRVFGVETYKN